MNREVVHLSLNVGNWQGVIIKTNLLCDHHVSQGKAALFLISVVLEMGHEAPFTGDTVVKATRHQNGRTHSGLLHVCQLRATIKVSDWVPITPAPR